MNVLIVEDEEKLARFLKQAVIESGYVAHTVGDGELACEMALYQHYDLILLDVMLPGMNGFDVCRSLRRSHITSLILIITARDSLQDKIDGLDSGADDYIVKPFQIAELLARMRALLRRGFAQPTVLRMADLTLEPAARRASRACKTIPLSATEYALLEYLMRNAGRVLTRSMILEHVWQFDFEGRDNVLDVYIGYLRNKIDRGFTPPLIHTLRGVGYMMDVKDAP